MVNTSNNNNDSNTNDRVLIQNKKMTQGRKKIEIKKIIEKNNLQVTFSKRRTGLFKKANELCLLCGAKVAIITFSPGRKAYTFGHPNVDSLLDCYLRNKNNAVENMEPYTDHAEHVNEANKEYEEALKKVEEERKRGEEIKESKNKNVVNGGGWFWWEETNVDELGLEELEIYVKSLQDLRENLMKRISELNMMDTWFATSTSNSNNNQSNNNIFHNKGPDSKLTLVNSKVNQNMIGGIGEGCSNYFDGYYGGFSGGTGGDCDGGFNGFGFGGMSF